MSNPSRGPDQEARFVALYDANYADLVRFAQRRVPAGQAEDVVAEAFLAAWRRADDLPRTMDDARAWLFGVTRHTILNSRRGADRQQAVAVRLAEIAHAPPDSAADLVAHQVDVAAAWNKLTAAHQEVLALAVLDDLSGPEAAAVLDISPVAFRLRLSRARRALRAQLRAPARAGTPERQLS